MELFRSLFVVLGAISTLARADLNVWLTTGLSVLMKLDTPGLPLTQYNPDTSTWDIISANSSLLFNFTITNNNQTLLLNSLPIYPLDNYNIPPVLSALNIPDDVPIDGLKLLPSTSAYRTVTLDYDRLMSSRDDPSIIYYNPAPKLTLNILGASSYLLDVPSQSVLQISMLDIHHTTSISPMRSYNIQSASFIARAPETRRPDDSYVHPHPHYANACSWWYYRCADFDDPPYYRFVWRAEFDSNGRIGSLRHSIVAVLHSTPYIFGVSWVAWILVFMGGLAGGMLGGAFFRVLRWVRAKSTERQDEEEAGQGLLDGMEESAVLGPRAGEYLLEPRERVEEEAPPSYDIATKELPPLPVVEGDDSEHGSVQAAARSIE